MQTTEKKPITRGKDVWKRELKDLFQRMPKDYKQRLIILYPEYDSLAGAELIKNFRNGVSRDIVLRRRLEEIADLYQQELQKES